MQQQDWQQELGSLQEPLANLNLQLSPQQTQQLAAFCDELSKWNRKFNLVSRQDIQRLPQRHIFDSLTGATLLSGLPNTAPEPSARVLDVGSGAGLPGIPLAVYRPDLHFVLLDRSERRVRFLRHVAEKLALTNVQTVQGDLSARTAVTDVLGPFDVIVARAVAPAAHLWAMASHLLVPGHGRVLIYARTQDQAPETADRPETAQMNLPAGVACTPHSFSMVATGQIHAILELAETDSV